MCGPDAWVIIAAVFLFGVGIGLLLKVNRQ